jgi:hypothetical protein
LSGVGTGEKIQICFDGKCRMCAAIINIVVRSAREGLFGPLSRVLWLKASVMFAFFIGLIMSLHLWIGPRSYPLAPVFSGSPSLAHPLDYLLLAIVSALGSMILLSIKPQKFIWAFLALLAVFCLLDQTRWQPWVYLYGFLLATLALFSWDSDDAAGRKRALNIARLIVAGTYVFSGLQKINMNFVETEFPWITPAHCWRPAVAEISAPSVGTSRAVHSGRLRHRTSDEKIPTRFARPGGLDARLYPGHVRSPRP